MKPEKTATLVTKDYCKNFYEFLNYYCLKNYKIPKNKQWKEIMVVQSNIWQCYDHSKKYKYVYAY